MAKHENKLLFEGNNDSLVRATELPELQPHAPSNSFSNSFGSRGRGHSGRQSFGRGSAPFGRKSFGDNSGHQRGSSSGHQRGGMKRPFQQQSNRNSVTNKKIKFD